MVPVTRLLVVLVAAGAFGSGFARAESGPPVEPIPGGGTPAAPRAISEPPVPPAPLAAPQARDEEAPSARPAAPDGRVANRAAPEAVEPGALQVTVGVLFGVAVSVVAGKTYFATHQNLWYTGAILLTGAGATGAIVCALGQTSPTRHGGCSASLAGALLGALGAVPGLLMLRASAGPCTATGPNADDACATGAAIGVLVGVGVGAIGYSLGTGIGARIGWDLGATNRPARQPTLASLPILTVRF